MLDRLAAESRGARTEWLLAEARGALHDRASEPELALACYARMRELRPDDVEGYVYAGGLLATLGRLAEIHSILQTHGVDSDDTSLLHWGWRQVLQDGPRGKGAPDASNDTHRRRPRG